LVDGRSNHSVCINNVVRLLKESIVPRDSAERPVETREGVTFQFVYHGTLRTIHYLKADNLSFLGRSISLSFYFHRGDSTGEGGSNQRWDSELLQRLAELSPARQPWFFVTDGEPGGFRTTLPQEVHSTVISVPNRREDYRYYFGRLWRS
jgi:hypothetical protein